MYEKTKIKSEMKKYSHLQIDTLDYILIKVLVFQKESHWFAVIPLPSHQPNWQCCLTWNWAINASGLFWLLSNVKTSKIPTQLTRNL